MSKLDKAYFKICANGDNDAPYYVQKKVMIGTDMFWIFEKAFTTFDKAKDHIKKLIIVRQIPDRLYDQDGHELSDDE